METKFRKKMNKKGAEDNFKQLMIGLIIFVGFSWLILSVATDFGTEYGKSSDDIGDGALTTSDYYDAVDDINDTTEDYWQRFDDGKVDDVDDASGVFSILTDTVSLITTPFTLISQVAYNILGVPKIIINIVLGLLMVVIILSVWRVLRAGA